jgi:hypothetical protein
MRGAESSPKALAFLLSADLGGTFPMGIAKPEQVRADGVRVCANCQVTSAVMAGFGLFPGSCFGRRRSI